MPVKKCPGTNRWRIGNGPCMYKSRAKAERAYAAYRARKNESDGDPDEPVEATLSKAIAVRMRRKRRKRRKVKTPGMTLRYTVNASDKDLDVFVEQAVRLALGRAMKGERC